MAEAEAEGTTESKSDKNTKKHFRGLQLNKKIKDKRAPLLKKYNEIVLIAIICDALANIVKKEWHKEREDRSFGTLIKILKDNLPQKMGKGAVQENNAIGKKSTQKEEKKKKRNDRNMESSLIDLLKNLELPPEWIPTLSDFLSCDELTEELRDKAMQKAREMVSESKVLQLKTWSNEKDIDEVNKLCNQKLTLNSSNPRTRLQNVGLHPSLSLMLKNTELFEPFLKVILFQPKPDPKPDPTQEPMQHPTQDTKNKTTTVTTSKVVNEKIHKFQNTPLHYALKMLHGSFIRWLLEQGAFVSLCNINHKTPLQSLIRKYNAIKRKIRIMKITKEKCEEYSTELTNCREFMLMLLEKGANFELVRQRCQQKLLFVAKHDKREKFIIAKLGEMQEEEMKAIIKWNTQLEAAVGLKQLEFCLRLKEEKKFKDKLYSFEDRDVEKVIACLLHTAVDFNLTKSVELIVKKYGTDIFAEFKTDETEKSKDPGTSGTSGKPNNSENTENFKNSENPETSGKPKNSKNPKNLKNPKNPKNSENSKTSEEPENSKTSKEPQSSKNSKKPENSKTNEATNNTIEPFKLKHRNVLRHLLRKTCKNANPTILKLLLQHMNRDKVLINSESILLQILGYCVNMVGESQRNADLLRCALLLASEPSIYFAKTTSIEGNTALHIALKYGLEDVAMTICMRQSRALLLVANRNGETPMDYAKPAFIEAILDNTVKPCNKKHQRGCLIELNGFISYNLKKLQLKKNLKIDYRTKFTAIGFFEQMSKSSTLRPHLNHPVIKTFVQIEWLRYSIVHGLNLILTLIFSSCYLYYAFQYCSQEQYSPISFWCSCLGLLYFVSREIFQSYLFRKHYLKQHENWFDFCSILCMFIVLLCSRLHGSLVPRYIMVPSSLNAILFAYEIICLTGTYWENFSTYRWMLVKVAQSFFVSHLVYLPILVAFFYDFVLIYNRKSSSNNTSNITEDNSIKETYNTFGTVIGAVVKTIVMSSGEFETSSIHIDLEKSIIFILFILCVTMMIQYLINGLAVSDISDIRSESELRKLENKVQLLAQIESGVNQIPCFQKTSKALCPGSPRLIKIIVEKNDCADMMVQYLPDHVQEKAEPETKPHSSESGHVAIHIEDSKDGELGTEKPSTTKNQNQSQNPRQAHASATPGSSHQAAENVDRNEPSRVEGELETEPFSPDMVFPNDQPGPSRNPGSSKHASTEVKAAETTNKYQTMSSAPEGVDQIRSLSSVSCARSPHSLETQEASLLIHPRNLADVQNNPSGVATRISQDKQDSNKKPAAKKPDWVYVTWTKLGWRNSKLGETRLRNLMRIIDQNRTKVTKDPSHKTVHSKPALQRDVKRKTIQNNKLWKVQSMPNLALTACVENKSQQESIHRTWKLWKIFYFEHISNE